MRALNELERFVADSIKVRGPMSIATWMRESLLHPEYGYYTKKSDVFGSQGDFVTSVEVSPMFCALVGVWVANAWRQMGRPRTMNVVEMGPGRGTLALEVARQLARDSEMSSSCQWQMHLVEASSTLANEQRTSLEREGHQKRCHWHTQLLEDGPWSKQPFVMIAHEYCDALPIYRFQWVPERGWCEELVDLNPDFFGPLHPDDPTTTQPIALPTTSAAPASSPAPFRLVLSPSPTPPALICLGNPRQPPPEGAASRVEVSPEAQSWARVFCQSMVQRPPSCGLVIDYGEFGPAEHSLRAIRRHKMVDPMDHSGQCDLSVNVDFRMLSNVARRCGAQPSACMTQKQWLQQMGMDVLVTQQLRRAGKDEVNVKRIIDEYQRVTDDMGTSYKVMAFAHNRSLLDKLL